MANKIIIDDGLKTYDIENKDGQVLGQFSFNPSDTSIIHRYEEVIKDLSELSFHEETENLDEELKRVEAVIYEKINYLLNADVAEAFFSIMGALTPLASGQYFIESVLDAIGQAIQIETGERVKKVSSKIAKHTSKYHG